MLLGTLSKLLFLGGAVAGATGGVAVALYFHCHHLSSDKGFISGFGVVNILGTPPVLTLAFTLGAAADSVAVTAGGVAVEALGEALAALAALSLAALY